MSVISLTIPARSKDLGGFTVGRILPFAKRHLVGPFIFLDHMGPAVFSAGQGMDVRPHPHIGLATVTYLFEGSMYHRDSLGSEQEILPGAVNWMTAGRGITHSERNNEAQKAQTRNMHGLQSWVALPKEFEEVEPEFHHHDAASLPRFELNKVALTLIAGTAYGHTAPVKIYSPLFYVEARMPAGTQLQVPADYAERALYLISGELNIGDDVIQPLCMPVFAEGANVVITARSDTHLVLLGGATLPEERFIFWNFVSTSQARIEQAKSDWKAGRFAKVPGDDEFIPLPE
ncbi:pirin family protein [Undibacterium sp. TS12]|uniref:pirin family protein n=1 Tax=Undibacterium sp. TS12 TaxID=2908202 RepID=UPI001F4C7D37|nr:pirin family protein [Undibacterium sp. TS12]MCH8622140.1 pirin family protein [Undibacterium sp. TS12]